MKIDSSQERLEVTTFRQTSLQANIPPKSSSKRPLIILEIIYSPHNDLDPPYHLLIWYGCCFVAKSCLTLCDPTEEHARPLSSTISRSLLTFMFTELVILSNHLILCHCLLLPSNFSSIKVFSNELALPIMWPKYWSQLQQRSFQWIFRVDFL